MEPFIGQITLFAGNFAPRGWLLCEGHILPIAQNTALFSLLGTTYGGDGRTTFGLPDLRGRAPVHVGTGAGLAPVAWGERKGAHDVTLQVSQIPSHGHGMVPAGEGVGLARTKDPTGVGFASAPGSMAYATDDDGPVAQTTSVGGGFPHENMPPYLAMNYIIATVGLFPSRS